MGKASRRRNRRRGKGRKARADESLTEGALRVQRFGKVVSIEKRSSAADHQRMLERLAGNFDALCASVDAACARVAEIVAPCDPLDLLMRCFMTRASASIAGGTTETQELVRLQQLLEYTQAVVVSIPPRTTTPEPITDTSWRELRNHTSIIFDKLGIEYLLAEHAKRKLEGVPHEHEDLRASAMTQWLCLRGERYMPHSRTHTLDTLRRQTPLLREALNVSATDIADAVDDMVRSLTQGHVQAIQEIDSIRTAMFDNIDAEKLAKEHPDKGPHDIFQILLHERGLSERLNQAFARAFGSHLFDLTKTTRLPDELLKDLSLEPGGAIGAGGLWDDGPNKGWPLRLSPTWNRPFLHIDGHHYLFNIHGIDRIHYLVEKLVRTRRPDLANRWLANRKATSERAPLAILCRLLPGSKCTRDVHYKWHTSPGSRKQWCECDAIISYDDILLAVEIKAGSFTYTSPSNDFDSHVTSLKTLIGAPTQQGSRFIDYLMSEEEVTIFDDNHKEKGRIRHQDYRRIAVCAVTWEQLTQYASVLQHEPFLRSNLAEVALWCVSIDDLRSISDIIRSPIRFTHYLEQRLLAHGEPQLSAVKGVDEMDHVGMYLKHNHYVTWAKDMLRNGVTSMTLNGYSTEIDDYFTSKWVDADASPPSQTCPTVLELIVDLLGRSKKNGRVIAGHAILDMDSEARSGFANAIESEITSQAERRNPRLLTASPMPISAIISVEPLTADRLEDLLRNAAARAVLAGNDYQVVLILEFDPDNGRIRELDFEIVDLSKLSPKTLHEASAVARKLQLEVRRATSATKIGRNEPCPCGSGKKYKRCCLL